ncbi:MAG TPA: arginase family protein, partial [Ktedonobacterales bacterium]|nr:arginase family protein [Ktedonobacterales bacterium]
PREERTRDTVTNLGRIAARARAATREGLRSGGFVLVLEGDCTHAVGPIGAVAQASGSAGVAWFDAHGDLNTMETSGSGYIGGMPYATALGWDLDDWRLLAGLEAPVRPEAAALLGTSDLDELEIEALARYPILHMPAEELSQPDVVRRVGDALRSRAAEAQGWYLHVDVDVAGPEEVPGGMTPAPHWPPRQNLIDAVAAAARTVPVRVLGLATYNPAGDPEGRGVRFGVDVVLAALGDIAR